MSSFAEETVGKDLQLFVPCANGVNEIAFNREKLVPNPIKTSSSHLKLYECIGNFFGLTVHSGDLFPINLAPFVWKKIVGGYADGKIRL